jgi:hypothetical protein
MQEISSERKNYQMRLDLKKDGEKDENCENNRRKRNYLKVAQNSFPVEY